MKSVVHAACPHDCPDACGVLITVEDGRATKIQGDPSHPVTRGFLCGKVAKYLDRVYSPDRVLYPMRRAAEKGTGHRDGRDFVRITWDEALTEITSRLKSVAQEFGPESVLPYSYGGTLGVLGYGSMDRRFFHRMGASQLERAICSTAGEAGLKSVYGVKMGTEPEQFRESKYIIAWASNIHGNNIHLWPFIEEARRKGAKLVVIDPYRTRTAALADWHLPINAGTDAALALAMMHVIINENLHDADYVSRYTLGFDQLKAKVQEYSPERAAQWTGISAEDIRKLAREYATTRPAVIRLNYGVQRSERGGMATRTVAMLPCITGSWKEVGGGLQMSLSGSFGLDRDVLERTDLMTSASPLGRPARVINMNRLGKALTELNDLSTNDPPVKALVVYNCNPAAVTPNHNLVIQGLKRKDLYTVVHEQFFTDTTDYADIVLPATTFFEHKDLQASYGHYFLQLSNQAVAPLGECKSNVELFRELARYMGYTEPYFSDSEDTMIDAALASGDPRIAGIHRTRLEKEGHARVNLSESAHSQNSEPFLPFAHGNFKTASGKAELYNEQLQTLGLDPVASFEPPEESRHGVAAKKFPLELLSRKADNFLNSSFCNIASVQAIQEVGFLEMAPADASLRGVHDGDSVRVFNDRGEVELTARVNGSVQPGTVASHLQWAKLSLGGKNINALTSEKLTDLGNSATFYSVLVEVESARPAV